MRQTYLLSAMIHYIADGGFPNMWQLQTTYPLNSSCSPLGLMYSFWVTFTHVQTLYTTHCSLQHTLVQLLTVKGIASTELNQSVVNT